MAGHAVDWYLMCEDLPDPESRIMVDGKDIVLHWRRSNMTAHRRADQGDARRLPRLPAIPIVLSRPFDKRTPSHQCGTVRIGDDPATSPLDPFCRAFDHQNLFVVDAGFLPTSAAVNPALTIAAQALRVADHIRRRSCETLRRHDPAPGVAIVTGGARGIGLRACAEALADAGFDILVADLARTKRPAKRSPPTSRATWREAALISRCDIADLADSRRGSSMPRCVAFGRIDCLVNNAGIGAVGARRPARAEAGELRPGARHQSARHRLPHPGRRRRCWRHAGDHPHSIITITSVSAEMASPERADYCISKAGLSMWVKNLALRLAPKASACSRCARASSAPT